MCNIFSNEVVVFRWKEKKKKKEQAAKSLQFSYIVSWQTKMSQCLKYKHTWLAFMTLLDSKLISEQKKRGDGDIPENIQFFL